MIYKKYEFSLSLNGTEIMHIARSAAGIVVFRARSDDELRTMIDTSVHEAEQVAAAEADKKAKAEEKKTDKKKKSLFGSTLEPDTEEESTEAPVDDTQTEQSILVPVAPPQTRVTRGSDGKFISKSVLDTEEEKKKGFWQKLTS